jgi:hypothetical protein
MQATTPNTNPPKKQASKKFGINKLGTLLSSQTTDTFDPGPLFKKSFARKR